MANQGLESTAAASYPAGFHISPPHWLDPSSFFLILICRTHHPREHFRLWEMTEQSTEKVAHRSAYAWNTGESQEKEKKNLHVPFSIKVISYPSDGRAETLKGQWGNPEISNTMKFLPPLGLTEQKKETMMPETRIRTFGGKDRTRGCLPWAGATGKKGCRLLSWKWQRLKRCLRNHPSVLPAPFMGHGWLMLIFDRKTTEFCKVIIL